MGFMRTDRDTLEHVRMVANAINDAGSDIARLCAILRYCATASETAMVDAAIKDAIDESANLNGGTR